MLKDIKSTLNQTISELGLKKGIEGAKVLTCWSQVAGNKVAQHTHAYRIKKDTLFVTTSSPVWAQELSLIKQELVNKINKRLGEERINDIRFLPRGDIKREEELKDESRESLNGVYLTKKEISKIESVVKDIPNTNLKDRLKRVIVSDSKLKKKCTKEKIKDGEK